MTFALFYSDSLYLCLLFYSATSSDFSPEWIILIGLSVFSMEPFT